MTTRRNPNDRPSIVCTPPSCTRAGPWTVDTTTRTRGRIEAGEGADDEGEWYAMDDSSVRRASLAEVREEQAYVLFYERAPGIPPPPHAVAPIESWGRDALGKESARENREDDEGDDAFASGRSTANEPSTGHLATPNPPRAPPPASARAGLAAFDPTGATALADLDEFDEHGEGERTTGPGVEPARDGGFADAHPVAACVTRVGYGAVVGDPRSPAAAALLGLRWLCEDDEDELGATTRMSRSGWFAAVMETEGCGGGTR